MSSYFSAGRLQWVIRGTRFGVTGDKSSLGDVLYFPRFSLLDGLVLELDFVVEDISNEIRR